MSNLSDRDIQETIQRYATRYQQFGYSPHTLGWNKGRQSIRFHALTSEFSLAGKRILDIGCGFGDLNFLLREQCGENYQYLGLDLVPDLISEARQRWPGKNIEFAVGDFSRRDPRSEVDIAIASGIFNHLLLGTDNYRFIESTISLAFECVTEGLAFDFLSDKTDFRHEHTFHSDPCRILQMAYKHSRRVILRNDYLPFEFGVIIRRDDTVDSTSGCYTSGPFPEDSTEQNRKANE